MAGINARGAASAASPISGTAIHRTLVFSRLALSAPLAGLGPGLRRGSTAYRWLTPASLERDVLNALGKDLL